MTSYSNSSYHIARRVGHQGARPPVGCQAGIEKNATDRDVSKDNRILKCRKTTLFSTFNCRTLNSSGKIGELTALAQEQNIDIICIQEHRIYHDDINIKFHDMKKGWVMITSSAQKASNNSTIRGVGFLLSPNAHKALNSVEPINPRTLIATFNGNPAVTVISCYSPTNVSTVDEKEEFYAELAELTKNIPKHNVILIGGDMNARIGESDAKGSVYNETTNENGQHLLDYMQECNLKALNTSFTKRKGKLWTHTSPAGARSQIDYILINNKWKNSVLNCEAYSTFCTVGSDHRIVTAKIRLSLRQSKISSKRKVKYNWNKLLTDNNIKNRYTVEVRNRYQALQDLDGNKDANQVYTNIMSAHEEAAKCSIPVKVRLKQRVPWEDENILEKRETAKKAYEESLKKKTRRSVAKLEDAKKELQEAYDLEQEKYVNEKINAITNAIEHQKSGLVWETVNELTGRKGTNKGRIKANSPEGRVKKWKVHFLNLLGQPPTVTSKPTVTVVHETLPINTKNISMDELIKCIKSFKNNKADGLDNIPIEVWKSGALDQQLLDVCNRTFNGDRPNMWVKSGLVPLPKKGDLGDTGNYRGISLTVTAAKIYNKILLNRIRPYVDPLLRENQNGFRAGRSTLAQILTLRRLIEGIKGKQLPAVLTFVDFSKAFDSIHRGKLMEILMAYGIAAKLVDAISILYKDTVAQVLTPDGDTEFFGILAGVLQGDTLAPFLFIIALDYALREATRDAHTGFTLTTRQSSRHPATYITDADFADDLALMSNYLEQAQLLLLRLEVAAEAVGLHVNFKKTEYMLYNLPDGDLVTLDGNKLKQVDDFKYLGAWIQSSEKDMNTRIGQAWSALNKMEKVWNSNLPNHLKVGFFRATVESVLLYGAESWTLTGKMSDRLDGTYTKMLRAVLGVSWKDHKTNQELYGKLMRVSDSLRVRRLRFIGHSWRRKEELISKVLMWEPKHGKRKRGRPSTTYLDQLRNDTGLSTEDLKRIMGNREEWRKLVNGVRVRSK